MTIASAILSGILWTLSVLSAVVVPVGALLANRRLVLQRQDRHVSATPVVGSLLGIMGIAFAPIGTFGDRLAWSWVPVAVEALVLGLAAVYWQLSGLRGKAEELRQSRRP